MIVYIQPPNIYFEIAAYIHAEGMYGCVTRYLVLYMRFWSTCLFFMKPSLPASPITRCVRYPDRLVPGMYVLPTPPVNPERPVSGTPHLLNILAPYLITSLMFIGNERPKQEKKLKEIKCYVKSPIIFFV